MLLLYEWENNFLYIMKAAIRFQNKALHSSLIYRWAKKWIITFSEGFFFYILPLAAPLYYLCLCFSFWPGLMGIRKRKMIFFQKQSPWRTAGNVWVFWLSLSISDFLPKIIKVGNAMHKTNLYFRVKFIWFIKYYNKWHKGLNLRSVVLLLGI